MRSTIETAIREAAAGDADFRSRLLADPAAAVHERFGVQIPNGMRLRVVEEAADEVVLVLPSAANAQLLSAADLDAATGADYRGVFVQSTKNV